MCVAGRIKPSPPLQRCPCPNRKTWDHATLHGKRDPAGVRKAPKRGQMAWVTQGGPGESLGSLQEGSRRVRVRDRLENVTMYGHGSRGMRAASGSWPREGKGFSPSASGKRAALLGFNQGEPSQIPDLQDCKRTHLCCCKPLRSQQFVTAAVGNPYRVCGKILTRDRKGCFTSTIPRRLEQDDGSRRQPGEQRGFD